MVPYDKRLCKASRSILKTFLIIKSTLKSIFRKALKENNAAIERKERLLWDY